MKVSAWHSGSMSLGRALARIFGQEAASSGGRLRGRANPLAMLLGVPEARLPRPDEPGEFLPLYRFQTQEDVDGYLITTDKLFGGHSEASVRLKEYKTFRSLLFEGRVEFSSDDPDHRGGFCNFRTMKRVRAGPIDEMAMTKAVQMRVKTDGRPYLVNFQCSDATDDDVWQAEVRTDPFMWQTVALPWSGFAHISRGLVREVQMELEPSKINGFGVTLADSRNGPFRFEIQFVRGMLGWEDEAWAPSEGVHSAVLTEQEAWERQERVGASADAPVGSYAPSSLRGTAERARGPDAGKDAEGRRVTPYVMSDEDRSDWRNARDAKGRRAVAQRLAKQLRDGSFERE
jgi:NADH dehydrogenase [ubiquinone] 1 alpha subcomplex assembly factor 1